MPPLPNRRRDLFNRLIRAREDGLRRLAQAGPLPDQTLARELAHPGADARFGVSLIAVPPPEVLAAVHAIQNRLHTREPGLYAYPSGDLRLVVLEVLFDTGQDQAAEVTRRVQELLPRLLEGLRSFRLGSPLFHFDERGGGISFLPDGDSLDRLRATLLERLEQNDLPHPRHASRRAHVAVIRYVASVQTGRKEWLELLSQTLAPSELAWEVREIYLTWGATAYGISARLQRAGPYRLKSTE